MDHKQSSDPQKTSRLNLPDGWTQEMVIQAVRRKCLQDIPGGVTADTLAQIRCLNGRSALRRALELQLLGQVKGGVTAEQLLNDIDDKGTSSLYIAIDKFWFKLEKIRDAPTFSQLAQAKNSRGDSAICAWALKLSPNRIEGGVTATQLASVLDSEGKAALYLAATSVSENLKFVDGVTAEDLLRACNSDGTPALMGLRDPRLVKNGVTWAQLASVRESEPRGWTALHNVAAAGKIAAIKGGVTAQQLNSVFDSEGTTAFLLAILHNPIAGILGGLPTEAVSSDQLDECLALLLGLSDRIASEKTPDGFLMSLWKQSFWATNVQMLLDAGGNPKLLVSGIETACRLAMKYPNRHDVFDRIRALTRMAFRLEIQVQLPPRIARRLL